MSTHVYEAHSPYSLSDWINYLSHDEIDLLAALAKALPERPAVVNIGAGAGTSALTFLGARPDLWLYTIDIALELNLYGGLENEIGILKAAGLLDYNRYLPIHGDSVQVGAGWKLGPVDLVFVDGDHTYAGARGDIETWWAHLKPGGLMAIHDYQKREAFSAKHPETPITAELLGTLIKPYPEVDKAVADVLLGRQEFVAQVDWTIVFRKAAQ